MDVRELKGFKSFYSVDKDGNVFSKRSNKFLRPGFRGEYLGYTLSINGIHYRMSAHRAVALSYIPNPNNLPCVNHRDGNKLNNNVNNLEWCTYSENEQHSHSVLKKVVRHSQKTREKMRAIALGRDMSEAIKKSAEVTRGKPSHNRKPVVLNNKEEFDCIRTASKAKGIGITTISNNLNGYSKSTSVGVWSFKN